MTSTTQYRLLLANVRGQGIAASPDIIGHLEETSRANA